VLEESLIHFGDNQTLVQVAAWVLGGSRGRTTRPFTTRSSASSRCRRPRR
jgi:hypothetical protein